MSNSCELSLVVQNYLSQYHKILDRMEQEMTQAGLNDSISQNFIVQMVPHHQAAIDMSQNLLQYTTCIPLQELARQIIVEQSNGITDMVRILEKCGEIQNMPKDLELFQCRMDEIMETMFHTMHCARATNQINPNFMREMIPHHAGAVAMSENALRFCICPELKPILDEIIRSQKRGIRQMQQLLRVAGG